MKQLHILKNIFDDLKPISIFLYGSRSRNDFLQNSDYEVWILFDDEKYISRWELSSKYDWENIQIYPFRISDFSKQNIDTPFPKGIYFYELSKSAQTLFWDKIVENINWVELRVIDLLLRVRFDIWVAMMWVLSLRQKDNDTAAQWLIKSCLYWLKVLEILQLSIFPNGYDDVYTYSNQLELWKYRNFIEVVYTARKQWTIPDEKYFYKNISFLNNYVEKILLDYYQEHGDIVILSK